MIWATFSSRSCFCWLYSASPPLSAKNIINLISVLTIWWCPCVESSLVLSEEGVCCDQCILLAKLDHELIPMVGVSCPTISDSGALQEKGLSQLGARKTLSFILLLEVYTLHYFHPLPLSSPPLATTIWWGIYEFGFLLIPHISDITRYLPFTISFISLSTVPPRSIHVVTNGRYPSFKEGCVCV